MDFSNEALQASEKGLERLLEGYTRLQKLKPSAQSSVDVAGLRAKCEEAMCDDLNTPMVISHLFEALKAVNLVHDGKATLSADDLAELQSVFHLFVEDLLGLQTADSLGTGLEAYKKAVDLLLDIRMEAKRNKDWTTSDRIRNELAAIGFEIKDTKDGVEWRL